MGTAAVVPVTLAATEGLARGVPAAAGAIKDALPSTERAGQAFQAVSKVAGSHTVPVTPGLSDAMMKYQQLVDAGGSRSLAVSKLMNRLTSPYGGPLTYDEARLFQSNISRLSADESQRLTPVMKRQVGQIASELNGAVEGTAANAGQLSIFEGRDKIDCIQYPFDSLQGPNPDRSIPLVVTRTGSPAPWFPLIYGDFGRARQSVWPASESEFGA